MLLHLNSEFYAWVRGGVFALFLYHLIFYFQNRNKLYLQFSFLLLVIGSYLVLNSSGHTKLYKYLGFPLLSLFLAMYINITRTLLKTRLKLPIVDSWAVVLKNIILFLAIVVPIIQHFFGIPIDLFSKTINVVLLTAYFIFYYILIKKVGDKQSWWFVSVSIVYLIMTFLTILRRFIGEELYLEYEINPMFFYYVAKIILCLLFSLLISYNVNQAEKHRKVIEVKLANKLKQIEELKMRALQSQMNPHFLFNSLNSINNFVLKNDIEKASDYITKFSKLIRFILNSSSTPLITLKEELNMLDLYVKLEQMRVTGGFDYILKLDKKIQTLKIKVPPLFLQPFIENAIWHGITKTNSKHKFIKIDIKKEGNFIIYKVIDNGIGLNKSLKQKKAPIHERRKFYGSEATKNRIQILFQSADIKVNTKDISENGKTGTQVYIKIPINGEIESYFL